MAESNFMSIEEMESLDLSQPMTQAQFSRLCWLNKSSISRGVKSRRIRLEPAGKIIPLKNMLFIATINTEKINDNLFMDLMYFRRAFFAKVQSN
jgi:hypothetical protein